MTELAQSILDDMVGQTISQLRFDYALTLLTDGGWWIVAEGPGTVDEHPFASGAAAAADHLVRLHRTSIRSSIIDDAQRLVISFDNGVTLTADLPDGYDAWHIVAPDKRRVLVDGDGKVVVVD